MFKFFSKQNIVILTSILVLMFFQNCNKVDFSPLNPQSASLDNNSNNSSFGTPQSPDFGVPNDTIIPVPPTVVTLPILGDYASIAFEDNVKSPNAGDRDYNDAVFNYKIEEKFNSLMQLTDIVLEVRVREKISGNNHRLYLYLNGDTGTDFSNISKISDKAINGMADITVTKPNGSIEELENLNHLIVVPQTNRSVGDVYTYNIKIKSPEANQVESFPDFIDFRKYRFILQNYGQTEGIDIAEINSTDEMLAADGYPLGFMIPTDWDPPTEGQLIDNKYSGFQLYRNWLSSEQTEQPSPEAAGWFL